MFIDFLTIYYLTDLPRISLDITEPVGQPQDFDSDFDGAKEIKTT